LNQAGEGGVLTVNEALSAKRTGDVLVSYQGKEDDQLVPNRAVGKTPRPKKKKFENPNVHKGPGRSPKGTTALGTGFVLKARRRAELDTGKKPMAILGITL